MHLIKNLEDIKTGNQLLLIELHEDNTDTIFVGVQLKKKNPQLGFCLTPDARNVS